MWFYAAMPWSAASTPKDPDNNFFPSPGQNSFVERAGEVPEVRFDDGVYAGWIVPGDYDPLLGKLIAWGADRGEAVARLRGALEEFDATGIKTNTGLFLAILNDGEFLAGNMHTRWLDERLAQLLAARKASKTRQGNAGGISAEDVAAIAAILWQLDQSGSLRESAVQAAPSRWKQEGRREQVAREPERSAP